MSFIYFLEGNECKITSKQLFTVHDIRQFVLGKDRGKLTESGRKQLGILPGSR